MTDTHRRRPRYLPEEIAFAVIRIEQGAGLPRSRSNLAAAFKGSSRDQIKRRIFGSSADSAVIVNICRTVVEQFCRLMVK